MTDKKITDRPLHPDLAKALDVPDDQLEDRIIELLRARGPMTAWPESWLDDDDRELIARAHERLRKNADTTGKNSVSRSSPYSISGHKKPLWSIVRVPVTIAAIFVIALSSFLVYFLSEDNGSVRISDMGLRRGIIPPSRKGFSRIDDAVIRSRALAPRKLLQKYLNHNLWKITFEAKKLTKKLNTYELTVDIKSREHLTSEERKSLGLFFFGALRRDQLGLPVWTRHFIPLKHVVGNQYTATVSRQHSAVPWAFVALGWTHQNSRYVVPILPELEVTTCKLSIVGVPQGHIPFLITDSPKRPIGKPTTKFEGISSQTNYRKWRYSVKWIWVESDLRNAFLDVQCRVESKNNYFAQFHSSSSTGVHLIADNIVYILKSIKLKKVSHGFIAENAVPKMTLAMKPIHYYLSQRVGTIPIRLPLNRLLSKEGKSTTISFLMKPNSSRYINSLNMSHELLQRRVWPVGVGAILVIKQVSSISKP